MATVIEIITLALKDINVIGVGDPVPAADASDCLATLNQMIGLWQADKMYVPAQKDVSFAVTGASSYTIGSGATINATLPVAIDSAFYRSNGVDEPIRVLTSFEDYNSIGSKAISGNPAAIFYRRTYPQGEIHVWPQPSTGEIHLITRDVLTTYTSLTDSLSVPDECVAAVRFSLAEMVAPMYGIEIRPSLRVLAKSARTIMKRNNLSIPYLGMPAAVLNNGVYNINNGN